VGALAFAVVSPQLGWMQPLLASVVVPCIAAVVIAATGLRQALLRKAAGRTIDGLWIVIDTASIGERRKTSA
jgi:hypothetical protein